MFKLKGPAYFLRKLDSIKSVSDKIYYVSLDVKSLYTSIPNAEVIRIILQTFKKRVI